MIFQYGGGGGGRPSEANFNTRRGGGIAKCTYMHACMHIRMYMLLNVHTPMHMGAQWLSGRVLDSRPKGRGFEPHRRHCVVVLEQDTFILA